MSPLRILYLCLALWGALHPMAYFISWFNQNGYSLFNMIAAWHTNAATSALTWDLIISAIALTVWIIAEFIQKRDKGTLLAIPAIFCIGVSCGLPLYLFLRSHPKNEIIETP